mmetsp:Transcript_155450/g.498740  ORF Transcript_155450/g.498740 Transcript_155450/m.498740 type:complete len:211 (+) Transcript_155450:184-816(+)
MGEAADPVFGFRLLLALVRVGETIMGACDGLLARLARAAGCERVRRARAAEPALRLVTLLAHVFLHATRIARLLLRATPRRVARLQSGMAAHSCDILREPDRFLVIIHRMRAAVRVELSLLLVNSECLGIRLGLHTQQSLSLLLHQVGECGELGPHPHVLSTELFPFLLAAALQEAEATHGNQRQVTNGPGCSRKLEGSRGAFKPKTART